ncbi:MAG: hypothetical protein ACI8X3_002745, partial [Saprospiraceae bacterium]
MRAGNLALLDSVNQTEIAKKKGGRG